MIKKHKALLAYMLALAVFTTYVVLDTFVITRVYGEASDDGTEAALQMDGNDDGAAQTEEGAADDTQSSAADDSESSHAHGPDGTHGSGSGHPSGGPGHGGKHSKSKDSSGSSSSGDSSDSSSGSSSKSSSGSSSSSSSGISSSTTTDSYSDGRISIELNEYTTDGTVVHVAEVKADPAYLKTAFAQGSYGKNVTAATSDIAESVNAILAINGDYYGAQEKGYVIRNGKLYRSTAVSGREDLVIYKDGSFGIINESDVTAEQLISDGAVQTLSFGPALVEDGNVSVGSGDEVTGRSMASNPRTAIGIKSDGTYIFVVSDGRTDESAGLSLLQLAEFMKSLGAETAYNLDGGGSSTMMFNGNVVNTPTGGGIGNGSGSERKVSDIVYIGY